MTHIIPDRFQTEINNHVAKFASRKTLRSLPVPQILIIAGAPGIGKTTMAKSALERLNVPYETISASVLGGEYEGQSVTPLKDAYTRISSEYTGFCSALIIDDYDLSAGRIDDNLSGTVNATLLNSFIMNIADNPFELSIAQQGQSTRVFNVPHPPILIMTANDSTKIYPALRREGRAYIFEWIPTPQEMATMLHGLYPRCNVRDIKTLINEFPDQPISFFEQLGIYRVNQKLSKELRKIPLEEIGKLDFNEYAEKITRTARYSSIRELINAGQALVNSSSGVNYLTV